MSKAHRLTARELEVPFSDKEQLAADKAPFMIADYSERDGQYEGKPRRESVFTIYLIDGPEAGYEQLLTLGVTANRQRLGKLVKQKAPRGPVILVKSLKTKEGKKRPNPLFIFQPVEDAKVIARADKLVDRLTREGMDTSADAEAMGAEDDDLPF